MFFNKERIVWEFVSKFTFETISIYPWLTIPFKDRITGSIKSNMNNGTCEMTIHRVQFEDAGSIVIKIRKTLFQPSLSQSTSLIVKPKGKQNF